MTLLLVRHIALLRNRHFHVEIASITRMFIFGTERRAVLADGNCCYQAISLKCPQGQMSEMAIFQQLRSHAADLGRCEGW